VISRREAAASLITAPLAGQKRRPNFLFLIADDHAGYVMGCSRNPLAETPHLDALASQGTRFASHFCNQPVCTPSRQSLLTGQMPSSAGVTVLRTPLDPSKPTLARQFQKAGYTTGVIGKMHFNMPGRPGLHGFDYCLTEDHLNRHMQQRGIERPVPSGVRVKPQWRPFRDPARIWLNAEKLPYPRHDADMKGTVQAGLACRFLEENKDKPFALWVSFHEPHSPYDFPVEDASHFTPERFPVPRTGPEDAWQVPLIFRDLTGGEKRGIAAAYYTSVRFLDRNLGIVLNRLRELNLEEETLVVYLADHGYCLGQHGRFEKHCGYDPALHVPLILRWPGRIRQGAVSEMTEHIDVAPTILDLMDLDPLPVQHGVSLRPYLEGKRARPRGHVFSQYLENEEVFLRTDRWKYIYCSGKRARTDGYETENPTPGRYHRLYDRKADPGEFTDVAAKNPRVVATLQNLILNRYRSSHPEAGNEPPSASREDALDFYVRPRDGGVER
jgi:arylsulfatase A-like enzyme